jgi:uncharacterized protein with HEPN domain
MRDYAQEAVALTMNKTRADLGTERVLDLALLHLITLIGEAANYVPPADVARYPEIPWKKITGMRHRLVHGYDKVNYDVLWETVTEDLPALVALLEKILTG